ncbi:carboxylesterase/lipase family protein [Thermus scotoductus]|uniref:Carboxylic ester hydrolase n=5 Tax=Thermus scotoductus TaxID=37636 RepID=A0A430QZS3_THESC|nr:carboxylesterase family protein [Thermus scotoductus]RTH00652.1 carboxylesterase [Thermus scotoductus]
MRPTLLFLLGSLALAQGFLASTPLGRAEGRWEDGAIAFYGLPYAEAGRFQAPRPLKVWPPGVGREKVACPQAFGITAAFGSPIPEEREECLVLNIFLPQALPPPEGFPVMVYLHGGGFGSGSAGEPLYGGHHLAAQGVVVVVPNYRLGPLGFLALPALAREDPKAVGNYALLDLLEALRFVQGYIRYFGGDPGNVTLFGESAGGMLVCTLLATPEARGLFHRAILQSGGCGYVRPLEGDFPKGEAWARARGCPPEDLGCLRALPLDRLLPRLSPLSLQDLDLGGRISDFLESPFKPHLSPLLPEDPRQVLARGGARGIPLIAGANLEELDLPALRGLWGPGSWGEFQARLEAELPKEKAQALLQGYRARFSSPALAYGALETDRILLCPSLKAARLQAPHAPAYAYLFTYRVPGLGGLGAFHGLELAPLFGHLRVPPFLPLFLTQEAYEGARRLGERMRRYWTSFAKEGEPRGWPRWPLYREGYLLLLDEPPGLLPDPYEERCGVLEALGLL